MADPITIATLVSGGLAAGATVLQAKSSAEAMNAQADADQQRAGLEQQWMNRRANEERAAAQSVANQEQRQAKLAQSRLGAVAGASGSGADDPTVMQLWKGISQEGDMNAAKAMAAGEQKASGMEYQSALDRWSADSNAAIKRAGAKSTLIGGYLSAGGQMGSAMAMRYRTPGTTARTGY